MRKILYSILSLLIIWLTACGQQQGSFDEKVGSLLRNSVPMIQPEELFNRLIKDTTLILLDAREQKEFDVSRIKNARFVGYDDFNMKMTEGIAKNTGIIVYCSIGYRSEKIGEKLIKAGYSNVLNLYGGIFGWVNKGFPVYDHLGNKTERVHVYSKKWGVWLLKGEKVYE